MTLIQIYIAANVFIAGTIWENFKPAKFNLYEIVWAIFWVAVFAFVGVPVALIGTIIDWFRHGGYRSFIIAIKKKLRTKKQKEQRRLELMIFKRKTQLL